MKPLNVTVVNPPGLTRPAVTLGQGPRVDLMDMGTQAQLLEPGWSCIGHWEGRRISGPPLS